MTNTWTGGQYSTFRAIFGVYLFAHFAHLLPFGAEIFSNLGMVADAAASPLYPLFPNLLFVWDSPVAVTSLLTLGLAASVALAVGHRDRVAAIVLWYVWACLLTRNPLILNPGLPFVGWLLLAHAALPKAPFGAWDARGRVDPDSGWRMPSPIHTAAWVVMAVAYSYSGATKLVSPSWIDGTALAHVLDNPLARPTFLRETLLSMPSVLIATATWGVLATELLFAPLALVLRLRPWLWLAMLGMHLGLMSLIDFADLSAGMILLHLFTFDPGWIRPRLSARPTLVFYDGGCGLCHRTIRFLLAEDAAGLRFRFAPLDSDAFRSACAAPESGFDDDASIPDSVMVQRPGEAMLTRSEGVLEIGHQLGGIWRLLAIVARLLPLSVLNAGYDFVASVRYRLFTRPSEACPLLSSDLRDRFDS
jgi:predicted DCC family thiol-disulfide oxidoreductase YuxK